MKRILDKRNMTEADWQVYRASQQGIGGSEIASILNINPYKSKFTLWLEKTGQKPKDQISSSAVEWGNILEPVIRDHFKRVTGFKVFKNNFVLQHDHYDFMIANLDGEVIDPQFNTRGVLEIKTTNERNKKDWENGCPIYYMSQVQWYLGVTGYDYAYICVLCGGSTFKYYLIERDEFVISQMISQAEDFMGMVQQLIPPEIGGSKSETEWLNKAFPDALEEEIMIPPTIEELAVEYKELQEEIKEKTERCDEIKNQIRLEAKEFKVLKGTKVKISMPTIRKTLFDSRRFSTENPDLYVKYKTKESSYRGFDITLL
jgi:putative phage-type endonuclease